MIRTERYKYVTLRNEPVEQLFDMKEDPSVRAQPRRMEN